MRRTILLCLSLFAGGCGASTLSTTAPTPDRCAIAASARETSFPAAGGTAAIAVDTTRECTWTVAADASWLVPDRTEGQGGASFSVRVMPNAAPSGRRGSLAIGSSRVDLIQEAAPCQFQIDASRIEVPGGGGGGRIQVTGIAGCGWTARAVEPWITVVRGAAGNGSDSVELSIAANDGPARQGTVAVAGHSVTVVQDAASAPAPSPAPGPAPGPPAPPAPAPPAPTPPAPTPPAPTPPAPTPPAPTPPAPAPPPPPAPPTGPVELEGTVSSVRGACPELTFVVAGTSVYTDGSTLYRRGNCRHVEAGTRVVVLGRRQPDGRVLAEQVDLDRE